MTAPVEAELRAVVARRFDPSAIGGITLDGSHVAVAIEIDPARASMIEPARRDTERDLLALPGIERASVVLTAAKRTGASTPPTPPPATQRAAKPPLEGVRHVIAVASGKGGVGKSTTTANLAVALAGLGLKVGVLDADIYGPSIHRVLAISGKPDVDPGTRKLIPKRSHGLKSMSIGVLIPDDQAMIWRGPMVQGAINQLLNEVDWAPLDVLVIDMPPGTGDAQLTLSQNAPLAGAVIVSTPQDLALIDAARAVAMFGKVAVPILGLIENMSLYICPQCGHEAHIFGHGGARDEARRLNIDFLGEIPLHLDIRRAADEGTPIVIAQPDGPHAAAYRAIAAVLMAKLEQGGASKPAPRISIV